MELLIMKKTNKNLNQCNYASSNAGHFRTHSKHTVEKGHTNVTNVTIHLLMQPIWSHLKSEEKNSNQCNYDTQESGSVLLGK